MFKKPPFCGGFLVAVFTASSLQCPPYLSVRHEGSDRIEKARHLGASRFTATNWLIDVILTAASTDQPRQLS